jgi:hypothetical protein
MMRACGKLNFIRRIGCLAVIFAVVTVLFALSLAAQEKVSIVGRPDISRTNDFYVGNRAPLVPSQFIPLCAVLQQSPALSDQPAEQVTLVPMGATRLRISSFPTIGSGSSANQWIAPPFP